MRSCRGMMGEGMNRWCEIRKSINACLTQSRKDAENSIPGSN
jgi:hypothetical protein